MSGNIKSINPLETSEQAGRILEQLGRSLIWFDIGVFVTSFALNWLLKTPLDDPNYFYSYYIAVELFVFGFAIAEHKARSAALLLAGTYISRTLIVLGGVLANKGGGWGYLILLFIVLRYALRATKVSFTYHKLRGSKVIVKNVLIKNALALFYLFAVFGLIYLLPVDTKSVVLHSFKTKTEPFNFLGVLVMALVLSAAYKGVLPGTSNRRLVVFEHG